MKRHESLTPLSREHHTALILAQLLKRGSPAYRGLPTTAADKAAYAIKIFRNTLLSHFKKEEAMLELVKEYNEKIKRLTLEIVEEHRQLTVAFKALKNADNLEEKMDELGKSLDWNIRKEERILFPLIEQHCPGEILAAIEV